METSTRSELQTELENSNHAVYHLGSSLVNSTEDFAVHLKASRRIAILLGAGLSAPSGMPTFRGAGSSWRGLPFRDLADPYFLKKDPVLFWQFYNYFRHLALKAKPNPGHYALAKLAQVKDCLTISQNIDGKKSPQCAGPPLK
jgi:NAD-dependent deacetylase sirtuin 5